VYVVVDDDDDNARKLAVKLAYSLLHDKTKEK